MIQIMQFSLNFRCTFVVKFWISMHIAICMQYVAISHARSIQSTIFSQYFSSFFFVANSPILLLLRKIPTLVQLISQNLPKLYKKYLIKAEGYIIITLVHEIVKGIQDVLTNWREMKLGTERDKEVETLTSTQYYEKDYFLLSHNLSFFYRQQLFVQ